MGVPSPAEYEAFWEEWYAEPETPAFVEKWNSPITGGGTSKIWNLEE